MALWGWNLPRTPSRWAKLASSPIHPSLPISSHCTLILDLPMANHGRHYPRQALGLLPNWPISRPRPASIQSLQLTSTLSSAARAPPLSCHNIRLSAITVATIEQGPHLDTLSGPLHTRPTSAEDVVLQLAPLPFHVLSGPQRTFRMCSKHQTLPLSCHRRRTRILLLRSKATSSRCTARITSLTSLRPIYTKSKSIH